MDNMKSKIYKNISLLIFAFGLTQGVLFSMNEAVEPDSNNIIWRDDFESGSMDGWEIINEVDDDTPGWFVEKGYLIQDTDCGNTKTLLGTNIVNGKAEWDNYTMRTNLVCTDDDYIGVLFRFTDVDNYYRFLLSSQRDLICIEKKVNGHFTRLAVTDEKWQYVKFSVTIALNDNNIKVYLNDELYFDVNDDEFKNGKIGFTSISNLGSFFDDVTVYSNYNVIQPETNLEICRGPYLQNVLEDHAVIMWDTSLPASSEVEYGLSKDETRTQADTAQTTKHEIKLEQLERDTTYYYRAISGTQKSEWYSFRTAIEGDKPFKFLAYGDTQMNFLRHKELVEQFSKHDYDFMINCGDVVQYGPRSDWDTEFFAPLKDILTGKPVYAAIGNHELNSENYYKNFANPDDTHENYYSFEYGNSFFIFIDNPLTAYPDKEYYTDYKPGSEQYKWLEEQLSSSEAQNAEWLFVMSHVPAYIGDTFDLFPGCRDYLVPLFEKYGVDISFSGHVHGYDRGEAKGVTYVITAGGGGAQNKNGWEEKNEYKGFKLVYNFCILEIDGSRLSFKAYDKENNLIDEFEITH